MHIDLTFSLIHADNVIALFTGTCASEMIPNQSVCKCFFSHYHIISMFVCVRVCVCACVCNGRSPEVIRPLAKCYFFLWAMATVGQREGAQ